MFAVLGELKSADHSGEQQLGPPVLLEREREVERLSECIDAAARSHGSTVAIEGAAGIGKSVLIARAAQLARARNMCVLTARGDELERNLPYGVVRQLFEMPVSAATVAERQRWLAGAADLAGPALGFPTQRAANRLPVVTGVLHGLYWLSANMSDEQSLLIAVDDAQWIDPASLRFISYLSRRVAGLPILILYAARPGDARSDRLPAAVEPQLVRVVLAPAPLSESATARLISQRFDSRCSDVFARACRQASGGNPFLLGELLRALEAVGIAPEERNVDQIAVIVPKTISRTLVARLRRLGRATTRFAFAVAVLGPRAQLRHAAALAELPSEVAGDVADALAAAGILYPQRPLRFAQPIVATAIYAEIPPARRAASHKHAAQLLQRDGASAEAVATHLLIAEPAGDHWVVAALCDAGAAALQRGAPEEATTYLKRALVEPPAAAERSDLARRLGSAELEAGQIGEATEHLEAALQLAVPGRERAVSALALARALAYGGDGVHAVEMLTAAISELDDEERQLKLRLEAARFAAGYGSLDAFRRLHAAGGRPDERRGEPQTPGERLRLGTLAFEAALHVSADRGAELATRALAAGALFDEVELDDAALYFPILALLYSDKLTEATHALTSILAMARERGSATAFATASQFRALAWWRRGALAEVEADARSAEVSPQGVAVGALALVDALLARGQVTGARELWATARLDDSLAGVGLGTLFLPTRARLYAAQGLREEALEDLRECARREKAWRIRSTAVVAWRPDAALLLAALGRPAEAEELAREDVQKGRARGSDRSLGIALRTLGLVATSGRLDVLAEAVAVLKRSPSRLEYAEALTELGAALRRAGERKSARGPLRDALELAHSCGATPLIDRAKQELLATGARPRRVARSGLESLTPSERRVAQLTSTGMSNREVAQALFVSVRTVETHLSHVYEKVDVRSRAGLAAVLPGSGSAAS